MSTRHEAAVKLIAQEGIPALSYILPWLWPSQGACCLSSASMAGQACSILYKTKLPLLLTFNKIDVVRHEFALDWMKDYEVFNEALQRDTTYAATLSRSLSLVCLLSI